MKRTRRSRNSSDFVDLKVECTFRFPEHVDGIEDNMRGSSDGGSSRCRYRIHLSSQAPAVTLIRCSCDKDIFALMKWIEVTLDTLIVKILVVAVSSRRSTHIILLL